MSRFYIIAMFALMSSVLQAQPKKHRSGSHAVSEMQSEVKGCMQALRKALIGKDSVALESLLADDLTYGHSNGWVQTKAGLIRSVMSGEQDYKKLEPGAMQIRIHGNTAIVNFESLVALDFRGEYLELDMDILLVWIQVEGKWKLIARQSVKNS